MPDFVLPSRYKIIDLGTLGGDTSEGNAITENGQVAGRATKTNSDIFHAVCWMGATIADLGTLGGSFSNGEGINNHGVVVGDTYTESDEYRAFIAPADTMIDLNTLIPPGSGWVLTRANDINNNGWITGTGMFNGQTRAYLLVPEV